MSRGPRRTAAALCCRILQAAMPPGLRAWGWAIRHEVAGIADDRDALRFAVHSLCGLAPRLIANHLLQPFITLADERTPGEPIAMHFADFAKRRPRATGIACAVGATLLGIGYMAVAGAPLAYLAVNAGALLLGLPILAAASRTPLPARGGEALILAMALPLLATALLGREIDGAARWFQAGPLFVQPSLILLPAMIVAFARARGGIATLGLSIAALALALQPDRAMAAMLAAGLAVLAALRPDRWSVAALAAALLGFATTLAQPDTLGAMPYVDQILYTAFDVHALAGLAVVGGAMLLLVPAVIGRLYDAGNREAYAVFGAVWLTAILAAAIGNYPTPVVGYSGGAVLGYVLSLTGLPKGQRACIGLHIAGREAEDAPADRQLCVGVALG